MESFSNSAESSQFEVADIFRRYGEEYRTGNGMTKKQHEVMYAISHCRTVFYGLHVDKCTDCGHMESEYNSCRDRHCPKCQGVARRKWVEKRLEGLLPVSYYHAVFTLPHLLHKIILYNRQLIYELLFSEASKTLTSFGRDPRWLGGELGFFGVLHTWGQTLWQHPHVHFIISGGALTKDGQWVEPKYRNKFLFPADQAQLQKAENFERWIDRLVGRNWVVYCKSPFEHAEKVVKYVGRYTHRVAISNQRIIGIENGKVSFWFKNYKKAGIVWEKMQLDAQEFIRRFLWHVLPHRFHKIRHFGFLANGRCKAAVGHIRKLLETSTKESDSCSEGAFEKICPICEKGVLVTCLIKDGFGRIVCWVSKNITNDPLFDTS